MENFKAIMEILTVNAKEVTTTFSCLYFPSKDLPNLTVIIGQKLEVHY